MSRPAPVRRLAPERAAMAEQARQRLTEAGVWDVEGDVAALLDRFLERAEPAAALAEFEAAVAERCARIPIGHITGTAHFDGLVFAVGSGVFVPRRHSVPMVDWAAEALPEGGRVLDLCAGVGALGIALSVRRADAEVVCVERDDTAVQYLRRNAARHAGPDGRVRVLVRDLLAPDCLADQRGLVDLVMANPPFVTPDFPLLPEWALHHPSAAVYSGPDGLDLIRAITAEAAEVLRPGGRVAFEHDREQPAAVHRVLAGAGFTEITTIADAAGEPRITTARTTAATAARTTDQETTR